MNERKCVLTNRHSAILADMVTDEVLSESFLSDKEQEARLVSFQAQTAETAMS